MNYLAHLHLAHITGTSLTGAFLGDFVKGRDLQQWDAQVQLGIMLHRKVDSYTDRHPVVSEMRNRFPKKLRRMAGIVLDISFDHFLARELNTSGAPSLDFLNIFYQQLATDKLVDQPRFNRLRESLIHDRWLMSYQHTNTCRQAFYAIERRLQGRIQFADNAMLFMSREYPHLEAAYRAFYPQLTTFARSCAQQLEAD